MDRFSPEVLAMAGEISADEYVKRTNAEPAHIARPKQSPLARQRIREAMTAWHRKNKRGTT